MAHSPYRGCRTGRDERRYKTEGDSVSLSYLYEVQKEPGETAASWVGKARPGQKQRRVEMKGNETRE